MLQTSRQVLRIVIFSIGFVLFVVVAVKSATQATNRQIVTGKPHLLPNNDLVVSRLQSPIVITATTSPQQSTIVVTRPAPTAKATSPMASDSKNAKSSESNGPASAAQSTDVAIKEEAKGKAKKSAEAQPAAKAVKAIKND